MEAQLEEKNQELQRVGDRGDVHVPAVRGGPGRVATLGAPDSSPLPSCHVHTWPVAMSAICLLVSDGPSSVSIGGRGRNGARGQCRRGQMGPHVPGGFLLLWPVRELLQVQVGPSGCPSNWRCWPGVPPKLE